MATFGERSVHLVNHMLSLNYVYLLAFCFVSGTAILITPAVSGNLLPFTFQ